MREHRFTLYTEVLKAIAGLRERSSAGAPFYAQCEYLLSRELTYVRDEEPVRVKRAIADWCSPRRVFKFVRRIWLPGNYQVFRHEYREGVETVERVRSEFTAERHDHGDFRRPADDMVRSTFSCCSSFNPSSLFFLDPHTGRYKHTLA